MLIPAATTHSLSDDGFDRLVANLYEVATGGCTWRSALTPIQELFGARAVVLHTTDLLDGRLHSLVFGGPEMERTAYDYVAAWEQRDPRKQHILSLGPGAIGQWLHCQDYQTETFVQRNAFYRHFFAAHEVRFNSTYLIALYERTITGLALELHASRGPLEADERELARRFGHHIEQALRGYERVRRLAAQSLVGHQLLQVFAYPMWLIDSERGIQYANDPARAVELGEVPVRRQHGRLRLADAQDDRRLTVRLHTLLQAPHHTRSPLRLGPAGALAEQSAWLHLSVLEPQQVMGLAFGPQRCVLATLFRPDQVSALDPFALAQMFDLTPAVARVAALLGEGLEPMAIAERLNVRLS